MNKQIIKLTLLATSISLLGCANNPSNKFSPENSYLKQSAQQLINTQQNEQFSKKANQNNDSNGQLVYLKGLTNQDNKLSKSTNIAQIFSTTKQVTISADKLQIKDFIHAVFDQILNKSYVLDKQLENDKQTVTLNIQHPVSEQRLFQLAEQVLQQRGYNIGYNEDIFYLHQAQQQGSDVVYGYGNKISDVPNTTSDIVQMVAFDYGIQNSLAGSLRQLLNVNAQLNFERNTLVLKGKQTEIKKALEFIQLMDQPIFRNRVIGVYKATYVSSDTLVEKLTELLKQEGITVSAKNQINEAVSIVPLDSIGAVILFANTKKLVDRAGFWAKQIDKAPTGNENQYFMFQPQYARASDLGQSLQMLLTGQSGGLSNSTSASAQNQQAKNNSTTQTKVLTAANDKMKMVVDERANAIIFQTSGDEYRQLLPLIKRLDVMPKQVILEMMIAEVKLTDVFKQGVEFALSNQLDQSVTGNFNLESKQKTGFSYVLTGMQGNLTVNFLQTNTNVNVLSRPSLLVRDGVTANINVGDDIPTVGEIVTDAVNGSRNSIVYRKTGVELQVKPTINARGVIIMEIEQKISNQAPGSSSVAGSPTVFERGLNTEVVAESGQTIILGGLISENRTLNDRSVPFFSSIPLLGKLFDGTDDTNERTELVVLVTPKIIESSREWDAIKQNLASQLQQIEIKQ